MKREAGTPSEISSEPKTRRKVENKISNTAYQVFGGCSLVTRNILKFIPEIFWPQLRAITRPMKQMVDHELAKLEILNYPSKFPGKQDLLKLAREDEEKARTIRVRLADFFSKFAPNLTDMPGGLVYFLPTMGKFRLCHGTGPWKHFCWGPDRLSGLRLTQEGPPYKEGSSLFGKSFQKAYPFGLTELDLFDLLIDDGCLFNGENRLRLPQLRKIVFPKHLYDSFCRDLEYISECKNVRDITLPCLRDTSCNLEESLKFGDSLERLSLCCCPNDLSESLWDDLFRGRSHIKSVQKKSADCLAPYFIRKLSTLDRIEELTLHLFDEFIDDEWESHEDEQHEATLDLLYQPNMRTLTNLDLCLRLQWHDRFFVVLNENLENLKDLKLRFSDRGEENAPVQTRRAFIDAPLQFLELSYVLRVKITTNEFPIELESGPILRNNLVKLSVCVEYDPFASANDHTIPLINSTIFVSKFLDGCNHLAKIEFEDPVSNSDLRRKIDELNLPKLIDLNVWEQCMSEGDSDESDEESDSEGMSLFVFEDFI